MSCDYKKYPANWKSEIRPDILKRADNRCEVCKVKNGIVVCRGFWNGVEVYQDDDGTIWATENGERIGDNYVGEVWAEKDNGIAKIVLTVAHLDHDETNNDYSNLKALCQLHHLRHDIKQHKQNSRATIENKKGLQRLF